MTDVHEILERERRHLPDTRRAGRKCASPYCSTRIYLPGLDTCRQCTRRAVNTSSHQRDNGQFAQATNGGAS